MSETFDDAEIELLARQRELAQGYREAARRALGFARRYRADEGSPGGERERAAIAQANAWRLAARTVQSLPPSSVARPGIARTRLSSQPDSDRKTG